ncbi:hypothetical protein OJF2_63650 [Aquisphaera giovannonii]|uniref:Uncharacterized protein n=1 Tax=Aquisphaera giovannonii TaxID=406548 RepID=A0A5B9WBY4_9BACT|nr:DUF6717 family protein [Aquisphaera giovannonii]QEH37774.1 hypothetical protein OJF2_63650 [Aquisphaera giovannonii]
MKAAKKSRLFLLAAIVLAVAAGVSVYVARATGLAGPSSNAIMVVAPYWYNGTWVFDDPAVGLRREPFVAGVPEMIDVLVKDIPGAKDGFRLLFSANPFPGHQKTLTWLRGDSQGNFYRLEGTSMEGWICPAMFRYYRRPPASLYVKAEPIAR